MKLLRTRLTAGVLAVLVLSLAAAASGAGQKAAKPKLPETYRKWLDDEVAYIIAPMEREVFLKLQTDRERDLFIEAFWKQRDPTPGTPGERVQDRALPPHRLRRPLSRPRRARPGHRTDRGPHLHHPRRAQGHPEVRGQVLDLRHRGLVLPGQDGPRAPGRIQRRLLQGRRPRRIPALQPDRRRTPGPAGGLFRRARITRRPTRSSRTSSRAWPPSRCPSSPAECRHRLRPAVDVRPTSSSSGSNPPAARSVEAQYAQKFLQYKDLDRGRVHGQLPRQRQPRSRSSAIPPGFYFVHYAVEPRRLSVNQYGTRTHTTLKVNGRVDDGRRPRSSISSTRPFSLNLTDEQMKSASRRRSIFQDLFPLVAGDYSLSVLIKNEASKEFTSVEQDPAHPRRRARPSS